MGGVSLDFDVKGWSHHKGVIPHDTIDTIRDIGIEMRIDVKKYSDWKGIPCASRFSKDLYKFYTSDIMYTVSQKYLGHRVSFQRPDSCQVTPRHYGVLTPL